MELTHLYALVPLLVFLIMSLVFYGKGLIHILTFLYTLCLSLFAILNSWEIMFFPVCLISGIISVILFFISMTRGNWL